MARTMSRGSNDGNQRHDSSKMATEQDYGIEALILDCDDTPQDQLDATCCAYCPCNDWSRVSSGYSKSSKGSDQSRKAENTWWLVSDPKQKREKLANKRMKDDEILLAYWRKTSGLHTVSEWCQNYHDHPGAFGALLMIHGVPEVSNRLRAKVDNCAIYSALFLSASLSVIFSPPETLDKQLDGWGYELGRRVFFAALSIGVVAHVLCIFLATAFTNALSEAARDSDVIRMFARGQGFNATVKCERAFRVGVAADFIGLLLVLYSLVGREVLAIILCSVVVASKIYLDTTTLLFNNGSLLGYWRKDTGGMPDADDPYDLGLPVEMLQKRARDGHNFDVVVADCKDEPHSDCSEESYFGDAVMEKTYSGLGNRSITAAGIF